MSEFDFFRLVLGVIILILYLLRVKSCYEDGISWVRFALEAIALIAIMSILYSDFIWIFIEEYLKSRYLKNIDILIGIGHA